MRQRLASFVVAALVAVVMVMSVPQGAEAKEPVVVDTCSGLIETLYMLSDDATGDMDAMAAYEAVYSAPGFNPNGPDGWVLDAWTWAQQDLDYTLGLFDDKVAYGRSLYCSGTFFE